MIRFETSSHTKTILIKGKLEIDLLVYRIWSELIIKRNYLIIIYIYMCKQFFNKHAKLLDINMHNIKFIIIEVF